MKGRGEEEGGRRGWRREERVEEGGEGEGGRRGWRREEEREKERVKECTQGSTGIGEE